MKKSSSAGSIQSETSLKKMEMGNTPDGTPGDGDSIKDFDAQSIGSDVVSISSFTSSGVFKQKKYQIELNIILLYVSDLKYFG